MVDIGDLNRDDFCARRDARRDGRADGNAGHVSAVVAIGNVRQARLRGAGFIPQIERRWCAGRAKRLDGAPVRCREARLSLDGQTRACRIDSRVDDRDRNPGARVWQTCAIIVPRLDGMKDLVRVAVQDLDARVLGDLQDHRIGLNAVEPPLRW